MIKYTNVRSCFEKRIKESAKRIKQSAKREY